MTCKWKKERYLEVQRRLERTRQEERTRRVYGSVRAWSFLALIAATAANVVALHRLVVHKKGADATEQTSDEGIKGAWDTISNAWHSLFRGCVDWDANGGLPGQVHKRAWLNPKGPSA